MLTNQFKADLIYGASHTRKTTNLGLAMDYFYQSRGLKSHLWSADGGGLEPLGLLIERGIVEVQTVGPDDPASIETLTRASQGWWPNKDGKLTAPGKDSPPLGVVAFEGIYSIGELILARLRHKGTKLQQGPSFDYADGSSVYHGGNMTYYGFAQELLKDWVGYSHTIPNTERVIWTSLEDSADNDVSRRREGGPASPGSKMVPRTAQWFCHTIHLTMEGDKHVAHLARHADRMGTEFAAGIRVPFQLAGKLPTQMSPGNMFEFYKMLDELRPAEEPKVKS